MTQKLILVTIHVDHNEFTVKIPTGSTIQEALKSAQVTLGELDQIDLPLFTVLSADSQIKVTRVKEEYYNVQVALPFEHQELNNEALPGGEQRLSQSGENGLEEITYRRVFEDGIEVSNDVFKSTIVKSAIPEIVMIGSQSKFASVAIPGRIAYLSAGNAWIIENTTSNRQLVVSSGDLDGRIFSLSKDGNYLLFTRFSSEPNKINSLWLALLLNNPIKLIDLKINNVIHFAEFNSDSNIIAYSTADWRETSPGWQANNDLYEITVSPNGIIGSPQLVLEPNSGGVYGWWGMDLSWSPDQFRFLFSRPDDIGIIDSHARTQNSLLTISPYQSGGNWAWVPGSTWSPNSKVVYTVNHAISNDNNSSNSQEFDLIAIPLSGGPPVNLVKNVGMFAYPSISPVIDNYGNLTNDAGIPLNQSSFSIAYLQAIFPDQSATSRYRLNLIDRDGSNPRSLFPEPSAVGLEPQHVVWSPSLMGAEGNYEIALIYNGNIWMTDTGTGLAQQVSGDGLASRVDWR